MKKNQQEIILKLGYYEQQIRQIHEQVQALDEAAAETSKLNEDLNDLKNSEGREIMAPIGRGIFIKSKIVSEDLLVDIGGGNLVKKNTKDTQKMISKQVQKLHEIKGELEGKLGEINEEISKILEEAQKYSE